LANQSSSHVLDFLNNNGFNEDYLVHLGTFPRLTYLQSPRLKLASSGNRFSVIKNITLNSNFPSLFSIAAGGIVNPATLTLNPDLFHDVIFRLNTNTTEEIIDGNLNYTYFNGKNDITQTLKVVAETIDPLDMPDLTLNKADVFVSFDGSVQEAPTLEQHYAGINKSFVDYFPAVASTVTLESVKGSPVYAKTKFKLINNSNHAVNKIKIMMKDISTSVQFNNNETSINLININNCQNQNLAPSQECVIDLRFVAAAGAPDLTSRFLTISWEIKPNQFITSFIKVDFKAIKPANVAILGATREQIKNLNNNITYTSHAFDFGVYKYNDPNHIILSTYPTTLYSRNNITLTNDSPLNASFSFLNPNPSSNPSDWNLIYNGANEVPMTNQIKVFANFHCFFGDVYNDVPLDQEVLTSPPLTLAA
jgi:hypothetical protein